MKTHFSGFAENVFGGKICFCDFRGKNAFCRENIFLRFRGKMNFGGKTRFAVFTRKHVLWFQREMHFDEKTHFSVLAGKHVLWFWRKNMFLCFGGKMRFWGLDVKTRFCYFGMKIRFCDFFALLMPKRTKLSSSSKWLIRTEKRTALLLLVICSAMSDEPGNKILFYIH